MKWSVCEVCFGSTRWTHEPDLEGSQQEDSQVKTVLH